MDNLFIITLALAVALMELRDRAGANLSETMKRISIKRYLPVKVFHIYYGYGWWWANYFFFFGKYRAPFIMVPMDREMQYSEYASNGNAIEHGDTDSWSESRQAEAKEERHSQS